MCNLLIYIFGRVKETIYIKTCKIKAHRSTCKIHKLVNRLHANYKNCVLQNQCCIYKTIPQIHTTVAKKPNPKSSTYITMISHSCTGGYIDVGPINSILESNCLSITSRNVRIVALGTKLHTLCLNRICSL